MAFSKTCTLSYGFTAANSLALQDLAPEYIMFETLQDLTGGQAVLMLGAFAHIADIAEPKYRTSRMALLEFRFVMHSN